MAFTDRTSSQKKKTQEFALSLILATVSLQWPSLHSLKAKQRFYVITVIEIWEPEILIIYWLRSWVKNSIRNTELIQESKLELDLECLILLKNKERFWVLTSKLQFIWKVWWKMKIYTEILKELNLKKWCFQWLKNSLLFYRKLFNYRVFKKTKFTVSKWLVKLQESHSYKRELRMCLVLIQAELWTL